MNISEILGTDYPIIQGGMANIADGRFAAEVSNVGALGVIGAGAMTIEELREEISICKSLTKNPFAVNLMLLHPDIDKFAKLVVEEGVKVITTGAGNPGKFVDYWKKNGIKVFPVVSSPALARRLLRLDIDGIIAEGSEAGGHIGELTTLSLIPEIRKQTNLPIIAAGGIASGSQMLAAKVLGANGVQLGTKFLATEECPIHDNYKESIIKAKDRSIVVIGRIGGIPVRLLRNSMTNTYIKEEKRGASKEELEKYVLGALRRAARDGDVKNGSLMAGQVAASIDEIVKLEDLVKDLFKDYQEELRRLKNEG